MMKLKVGDKHEAVVIENVIRTHIVKYAGASGDFNPLHHDDTFAQRAGYPTVFAHGMLSMGLTGTFLTKWLGAGNLKKYGVRFTKQVFPGDTLTATGEVIDVKEEGGKQIATIRVITLNQKGESVVEGEAVAAL
jgi:acyl dehydratase